MEYSLSDLKQEIADIIRGDNAPVKINPAWITQAIMAAHDDGNVSGFHAATSRAYVRAEVSRFVGKMRDGATSEQLQMVMPGFEFLQERYPVKVGDEINLIRTEHLTRDQLEEKIAEYETMRDGMSRHIQELRGYLASRFGASEAV